MKDKFSTMALGIFSILFMMSVNVVAQQPGRGRGMTDKSDDNVLQQLIKENLHKFSQWEYQDAETGKSMEYNLYVPENYDGEKSYPLLLFIADASTVRKEVTSPLTQGYGALVWATREEQVKHPCFILVPQYTTRTVTDQGETSYEVEMTLRLLEAIVGKYNIDRNRLYTTGQSMGGMMSLYFNIAHPDLFAASLFVGCQWDATNMGHFVDDKFFYVVAAGDKKAPIGMEALKKVLLAKGANIATAEWSARLPQAEQEAQVQDLIAKGSRQNFVVFTEGSVIPEGKGGMEHMWSFDYAYKLEGVRDWLFRQAKE